MLLERWQQFDLTIMPISGTLVLVQRGTRPWCGRALFLDKQSDGSYVYSCGIEEQGVPAVCFGAASALGWVLAREMFEKTDINLWSEMIGQKQGAD